MLNKETWEWIKQQQKCKPKQSTSNNPETKTKQQGFNKHKPKQPTHHFHPRCVWDCSVAITHQGWSTSCAQSALQSAQTGLLLFSDKEVGQVYSQRQCQTICPALLTVSDLKLLYLKNKLHCFLFTVRSVSCSQFTVFGVHGIFM